MAETEGRIRRCTPDDAAAIARIYDPIVAQTSISFEDEPPGPRELAKRIAAGADRYPWLAFERAGELVGYVYASAHRTRAAYRWSVDVSAYVDARARRGGVARRLYESLFAMLERQGYRAAFAGIALPNDASVALHESLRFTRVGIYHSVGFKLGAWRDVMWLERRIGDSSLPPGEIRDAEPRLFAR